LINVKEPYGLWIDIPSYMGKYQVSRDGEIRRVFQNGKTRLLTPYHKKMIGSQRLVVKLSLNGKAREIVVMQLVARAFLGECPIGFVPYHKNGCQSDNYVANIEYISRKDLGKRTGAQANRRPVCKISADGEIVEAYSSAREAGRCNFLSYQTVSNRCNGKCKGLFASDGYAYAWDDDEKAIEKLIHKIKSEVKKDDVQR